MNKTVIIVAGGKGNRMKADIPKQFIEVNGKPILMRTMERFHEYDGNILIVVVLPEEQINYWRELCGEKKFSIPHQITHGGETRFHSVKNGLALAHNTGLIAIHDGVRPFVSLETIERCYDAAEKYHAAIPVIDMVDSLRKITETGSVVCDRTQYKMVQTPQVFNAELIKKAYEQKYVPLFTDDASVVEAYGTPVRMVEGNRENIKITTSFDLKPASCLAD